MRVTLTDRSLPKLAAPAKGEPQVDYFDKGVPGFALRVSANGARSWIVLYRRHGRKQRVTLGPEEALLRKVWNFGIKRDLVETNPCALLDRPAPERQRDRVLTADELRAVWKASEGEDQQTAALFKLYLLTAQRGGELRSMEWNELDLDAGSW